MHLRHIRAHVLQEKSLAISELDVCAAVKGPQERGYVSPYVTVGVVLGVEKLEGSSPRRICNEGVRVVIYWKAGVV